MSERTLEGLKEIERQRKEKMVLVALKQRRVDRLERELAKANDEIARLQVAGQVADKLNVSFETALGWSDEEIIERVLDI